MKSWLALSVFALSCGLSGCVTRAEHDYQVKQNRHFSDADVQTAMTQKAVALFPEVNAKLRAAHDSGAAFITPKLTTTVMPKYPAGKAWKGAQSGVWVAFVVNETGGVEDARPLSDEEIPQDPAFIAAALTAVNQWKFSPATSGGQPLRYILCAPIIFQLR